MARGKTIEAVPTGMGDFSIMVDGRRWCYAIREARGMHGANYKFHYTSAHEPIHEPAKRGSPAVAWSDKHWLNSLGIYGSVSMAKRQAVFEGKYKPIQQRIAETAARLIRKKLIVSPEKLAQQREARAVEDRRRREEFEAATRKRLDDRAKEIVKKFATGDTVVYQDDRKRLQTLIVEAMEWARSNT